MTLLILEAVIVPSIGAITSSPSESLLMQCDMIYKIASNLHFPKLIIIIL